MKRTMMVAILGLTGLGFSACGSSTSDLTPQGACNEAMSATCQKVSTCAGAAGLAALGATSVADCTTQMEAQSCTAADVTCTAPQKFSAANAQACINAINALTCAALTSSTSADPTPAVCNQVCQ
jgi:hypothetical protein